MSVNIANARGGEFATSRKGGLDAYEVAFIQQKLDACVPWSAIAKMLGRPIDDIRTRASLAPSAPIVESTSHAGAELGSVQPTWRPRCRVPRLRMMPAAVREVVEAVAIHHGVTPQSMVGPSHKRVYAFARHEAWHLLYATGRYSLPQIGSWFGGRDHTTVLNGIRGYVRRAAMLDAASIPGRRSR
jgi:hypothetical protein